MSDVIYYLLVFFFIILSALVFLLVSENRELKKERFDSEIHLSRHDLEKRIDNMIASSEHVRATLPLTTVREVYWCGYESALIDLEKYLKGHASDSFTDKNKHDV